MKRNHTIGPAGCALFALCSLPVCCVLPVALEGAAPFLCAGALLAFSFYIVLLAVVGGLGKG